MKGGSNGISIVVICLDEGDYLDECLRSIDQAAGQTNLRVDVLIVDGGSIDDTIAVAYYWVEKLDGHMKVEVVRCDWAGYSYQRNMGVAHARQPWVAFLSADVRVGKDWLSGLEPHLKADIDLVVGRFDLVTPPGRLPWLSALAASVYPTCTKDLVTEHCSTVHLVARRKALASTPFDENLVACEDKDLAFRLQRSPSWRGVAYATHRPTHLARERLSRFVAKLGREAYALGLITRRHGLEFPDCFGWRQSARRLAAAAFAAVIWCFVLTPWHAAFAIVVGFGLAAHHRAGWSRRNPLLSIPAQFLLHAAAMTTISVCWIAGWVRGPTMSRKLCPMASQRSE